MPFDPEEYLKKKQGSATAGGFDPEAYLKKKMQPNKPVPASVGESAVSGLADILTFGHSDEIAAGGQALIDKLTDGGDYSELYKKNRQIMRDHKKKMEADNPKTFKGAQIAGGIGSAIATGGLLGAAGNTQRALGLAAMGGATAGQGYSEADFGTGQNLLDTGIGAGLGAATFGVGQAAGKALKGAGDLVGNSSAGKAVRNWMSSKLDDVATERAAKAAIGQNSSAFEQIAARKGGIKGFGRRLLDEKLDDGTSLIRFGNNVDEIGEKALTKIKEVGPKYNEVYKQLDELAPDGAVKPEAIADAIMKRADDFGQVANRGTKDRLYKEADAFINIPGKMSMQAAKAEKNAYRWTPKKGLPKPDELDPKLQNELKDIVGKEMKKSAKELSPELATKLDKLDDTFGPIKQTADLATKRKLKDLSNRFISPSDHAVGLAGLMSNLGGLKAAGLALANKQIRTRGNAATAVAADKLSKAIRAMPEAFGKYGSVLTKANEKGAQHLGLTHHLLWKNDPEYRALFSLDRVGQEPLSAKSLEDRK